MGSIPIGSAIAPPAGVARRLAALAYDLLLLGALWMASTLVIVIARGGTAIGPGNTAYQLLLGGLATAFFVGFWMRGGQTLGMRAWRLRVQLPTGADLDAVTALKRFAAGLIAVATGGLGLFWLWVDRDRLPWHDRLAGTRVVVLPKPDRASNRG
jgi:uncharacterized RDD family membrane protein YckC